MRVVLLSIVLIWRMASAPAFAQAVDERHHLNIVRQPLETALEDLAHQTGLQIALFRDAVDASFLVGPVRGDLSTQQALEILLVASGLRYKMVNDRTIAVVRNEPVPTQYPTQVPPPSKKK